MTITELLGAPVLLAGQTSWTNGEVSVALWSNGCWRVETESHGLVQAGSARDEKTARKHIKRKLEEIL